MVIINKLWIVRKLVHLNWSSDERRLFTPVTGNIPKKWPATIIGQIASWKPPRKLLLTPKIIEKSKISYTLTLYWTKLLCNTAKREVGRFIVRLKFKQYTRQFFLTTKSNLFYRPTMQRFDKQFFQTLSAFHLGTA